MENEPLASGLYIVATPIGNLGDITRRAVNILTNCDAVACEDTRVTLKLLSHLGLSKPLWRYDDHSDASDRERLIGQMREKAIALVSDAGTPLISDPGMKLVREAREAGIAITSLPGPSAPIMALTLSGLPSDRFLFAGFLPSKDKARREMLEGLAGLRSTLIFFESSQRLLKSLEAFVQLLPGRRVAVARELTKRYEECRTGSAEEMISYYSAHPPKGEIVLMAGPPPEREASDFDSDAMLFEALQSAKPSQAAAHVAKATGLDRKMLYARAMVLKQAP